jgi:hypothetical protein
MPGNRPTGFSPSHHPHPSHDGPVRRSSQFLHAPVSSDQINHLRTQIHAFELSPHSVPTPEPLCGVIRNPHHTTPELERLPPTARVIADVLNVPNLFNSTPGTNHAERASAPRPTLKVEDGGPDPLQQTAFEDNANSGIYPYNAYVHSFSEVEPFKDPGYSALNFGGFSYLQSRRTPQPTCVPMALGPPKSLSVTSATSLDERISAFYVPVAS